MSLTDGQRKVLDAAAGFGASKGNFHGKHWRNFDQLERKGLIQRQAYTGFYFLTDAGAKLWDATLPSQGGKTAGPDPVGGAR